MKRAVVFAHYDSQNIIEDYVVYYLTELKKTADKIVFVSDCALNQEELNKISTLANHIIANPHGEYDFGSYKRGFEFLLQNNPEQYDELILANDSCFGPIIPINPPVGEYDFWGINKNEIDTPLHIQSFFFGFKKNVFISEVFKDILLSVKKEEDKDTIVKKYEIGLTQTLIKNGFNFKTLFEDPIERQITGDLIHKRPINPLIKVCTVKKGTINFIHLIFKPLLQNYSFELIEKFMKNKGCRGNVKNNISILSKLMFRLQLKRRRAYFLKRWYKF